MTNFVDIDDALDRAKRSYGRLRRADARLGFSWPIIPDRRWDALEDGPGVVVTGYNGVSPGIGFDGPIVRYRVTRSRVTRMGCAAA